MKVFLTLYTTAVLLLSGILIAYYALAKKDAKGKKSENVEIAMVNMIVSVVLLLFFTYGKIEEVHIYFYSLITLCTALRIIYILFRNQEVSVIHYIGVGVFTGIWGIYAIAQGFDYVTVMTPTILLQSALYFCIGVLYLIRNKEEIIGINCTSFLFLFIAVVKLFYILKNTIEIEYMVGIIAIDFTLYAIVAIFLGIYEYNDMALSLDQEDLAFQLKLQYIGIGMLHVDKNGNILHSNMAGKEYLQMNNYSEDVRKKLNINEFAFMKGKMSWKDIMVGTNKGKTVVLQVILQTQEGKIPHQLLFSPFLEVEEETIMVSFLKNEGKVESEEKETEERCEEVFETKDRCMRNMKYVLQKEKWTRYVVIYMEILNQKEIASKVFEEEKCGLDRVLHRKFNEFDWIQYVAKDGVNTYMIVTGTIEEKKVVTTYVEELKELLYELKFYDENLNTYKLSYNIGITVGNHIKNFEDIIKQSQKSLDKAKKTAKNLILIDDEVDI